MKHATKLRCQKIGRTFMKWDRIYSVVKVTSHMGSSDQSGESANICSFWENKRDNRVDHVNKGKCF